MTQFGSGSRVLFERMGEKMLLKTNQSLLLIAAVLLSMAVGRAGTLPADLATKYFISTVAPDGTVLQQGTVLILQKDGLAVYGINAPLPALNTWKNGKLSAGVGRALSVGVAMKNQGATDLPMRKCAAGETFWIIGMAVEKDATVFRLLSDMVGGFRYYADLKFPFPKNNPPPLDQAIAQISEVVTIQEPKQPEVTESGSAPVRTSRKKAMAEVAPETQPDKPPDKPMDPIPAPAPPVESITVNLGDTIEKVVAAMGQPKNIVNLGAKQIYVYASLKVTFQDGKVIDVQ